MLEEHIPLRAANMKELQDAVLVVGNAMRFVYEYKKDNRLGIPEIKIGWELLHQIPDLMSRSSIIFPEWRDLDRPSQDDLIQYIKRNISYPGDMEVELVAKRILATIVKSAEIAKIWM